MEKQIIKLDEATLRKLVVECINETIENGELEEGFLDNVKAGAKSAFGKGAGSNNPKNKNIRQKGGLNIGKRWNAAKAGYNAQDTSDKIDNVVNYLKELIDSGKIDPEQSVQQLVYSTGGKNKFGKGNLSTLKAHANSKASKAQNDIYR